MGRDVPFEQGGDDLMSRHPAAVGQTLAAVPLARTPAQTGDETTDVRRGRGTGRWDAPRGTVREIQHKDGQQQYQRYTNRL